MFGEARGQSPNSLHSVFFFLFIKQQIRKSDRLIVVMKQANNMTAQQKAAHGGASGAKESSDLESCDTPDRTVFLLLHIFSIMRTIINDYA